MYTAARAETNWRRGTK